MSYQDPPYEHPANTHGAEFIALINLWRKGVIDTLNNFAGRQIGASATLSVSQSIAATVNTKVDFDTVGWDLGGNYDSINKRFTVPTSGAGRYRVSGKITYEITADQQTIRAIIYKNGSSFDSTFIVSSGVPFQCAQFNMVFDLSEGDYIEIYGYAGSADTINVSNSIFQVEYLGT